ncbi:MAG: hypothetical protein ACTSUO_03355 [Candidatus Thorarchaeota archaeon]
MIGVERSRLVIVTFVIGLFLGGFVVAHASQYVLPLDADGTTISETIFKNLETNGKSPVFDMTGMEPDEQSFRIDSSLWNQPMISLSEATEAAYSFLSFNFDDIILESLAVVWSHMAGSRPTWVLHFKGLYIVTQIHVNALTGEVIGWNLSSLTMNMPNPFYENGSYITSEIAAQRAFDFLEDNNYSIPENAQYLGTLDYSSDESNYYVIFRHYEGVIPVGVYPFDPNSNPDFSYEGIILRVNKLSGTVTQFGYKWTKVSQISSTGIISEWDSNTVTRNYFASGNATILKTEILLTDIDDLESSDGSPQIRLSWVNYVNHDSKLTVIFVDSYTREVLQELRTNGPPPFSASSELQLPNVTIPIVSGICIGFVFAILTNHYIRKRYSL